MIRSEVLQLLIASHGKITSPRKPVGNFAAFASRPNFDSIDSQYPHRTKVLNMRTPTADLHTAQSCQSLCCLYLYKSRFSVIGLPASRSFKRLFIALILCMLGNFPAFFFWLSADFFQNHFFQKILSGIPSECRTVWIQIRPDILSGLIWVQTVYKDYQQTELAWKELIVHFIDCRLLT